MADDIDPAVQIALGLALGGLQGFAKRKRLKKEDAREDEKFALEKKRTEASTEESNTRLKVATLEYEIAMLRGTPEEQAAKRNELEAEARRYEKLRADKAEFELQTAPEEFEMKKATQAKSGQYMDAMIGQMGRSGGSGGGGASGGAGGGGGGAGVTGEGMDIATQRRLSTMTQRAALYKDAHMLDDGSWDSKESHTQYMSMIGEIDQELAAATGMSIGQGAAPVAAPVDKAGAGQVKPKALQFGERNPMAPVGQKPMAERGAFENIGYQLSKPIAGIRKLFGGTPYEVVATGEPFDASKMTPEQIESATKQGIIRPKEMGIPMAGEMAGY